MSLSDHRRTCTNPHHLSSKPQHPSRRVPLNASPHHAGWKAKASLLFPFNAYSLRHTSVVSVVRATCQIRPDAAYQIHDHTFLLRVHMGVPRGMEDVARTQRYLDHLLSVPPQLVNRRVGSWSVTLVNPAQVVSKRCVRIPLQFTPIDPGCTAPVTHATSPSTTIRNAMTQHSRILTTTLIYYTTSAIAFTFFHIVSSPQTPNGDLRFFVKSKYVL